MTVVARSPNALLKRLAERVVLGWTELALAPSRPRCPVGSLTCINTRLAFSARADKCKYATLSVANAAVKFFGNLYLLLRAGGRAAQREPNQNRRDDFLPLLILVSILPCFSPRSKELFSTILVLLTILALGSVPLRMRRSLSERMGMVESAAWIGLTRG